MAASDARIDRAVVLAGLWVARHGSQQERVRLAVLCAAAGARQANAGQSLGTLIADIDDLENSVFRDLVESSEDVAADIAHVHACCSRMRAAAIAGFNHATATAARTRVRAARHDIVNNIGTVRNAILLMDDEPDPVAREHFRAIAKRNSVTSEHLVRSHLSEEPVGGGVSADAEALVAEELNVCADRPCEPATRSAIQELAAIIGVSVSAADPNELRLSRAGSRLNQRHDLGRSSERDHTDTLGL